MKIYKNLPLGTVVKLKGIRRYIMITSKDTTYNNYNCDYIGVYYPYGFSSQEELLPFNNDMIVKIIFLGNTNY